MPTVYVTRKAHFNAAHRLHNPAKSDEWNRETFGLCNNPNWHGHNYELEVTVAGEPDPDTGYVVRLAQLQRIVGGRVVSRRHLRHLRLDVGFLQGGMPATENGAGAIWRQLEGALPGPGRLHEVVRRETP